MTLLLWGFKTKNTLVKIKKNSELTKNALLKRDLRTSMRRDGEHNIEHRQKVLLTVDCSVASRAANFVYSFFSKIEEKAQLKKVSKTLQVNKNRESFTFAFKAVMHLRGLNFLKYLQKKILDIFFKK